MRRSKQFFHLTFYNPGPVLLETDKNPLHFFLENSYFETFLALLKFLNLIISRAEIYEV